MNGIFNQFVGQFLEHPVPGKLFFIICIKFLFQADRILLDAVEGLQPIKEKHQFFIDVQPVRDC